MLDFPQMPKRSVELPLGCKDLMDVEAIRNWKSVGGLDLPWRETADQIAYIEGQLAEFLQAAGMPKLVSLSRHRDYGQVMVTSDPELSASTILAHSRDATEQQAIRKVFEEAGMPPLTGPVGRWKFRNALKYQLPAQSSDGARLIGELFRSGYGLGDLTVIHLSYHEPKRA